MPIGYSHPRYPQFLRWDGRWPCSPLMRAIHSAGVVVNIAHELDYPATLTERRNSHGDVGQIWRT